jgi:homoserine kinase type II
MSVYTPVTPDALAPWLDRYRLGPCVSLTGIPEGIDNTNYRLETQHGVFILTLVEHPERQAALPEIIRVLGWLSRHGVPVPATVGEILTLHGRPAVLMGWLPGTWPRRPDADMARQVGAVLGRIHRVSDGLLVRRVNPVGLPVWAEILTRLERQSRLGTQDPVLLPWLREAWQQAAAFFAQSLPSGLCHGDLFPDNTLFVGDRLCGVLDFYFAFHGPWIYDVAIALNSWGFDADGVPDRERMRALWKGYQSQRIVTETERAALPAALQAAALRFSLTRLRDWHFPRAGDQVTRKPPEEFLRILCHHRGGTQFDI